MSARPRCNQSKLGSFSPSDEVEGGRAVAPSTGGLFGPRRSQKARRSQTPPKSEARGSGDGQHVLLVTMRSREPPRYSWRVDNVSM